MTTWAASKQLSLLADPIDVRFAEFVHANPWFLPRLAELAREWKSRGFASISMDSLFHQIRIERWQVEGCDQFKINNDFSSRASRVLMATHADLVGFFPTRAIKSDYQESA